MTPFSFSSRGLRGRQKALQRVFEVLPGLLSWSLLIGMAFLSFWRPILAAAFIIAFDLYWLLRIFYTTIFLLLSYFRLSIEKKVDWMARIKDLDGKDPGAIRFKKDGTLKERFANQMRRLEVKRLLQSGKMPPPSDQIHHLVIVPVVRESAQIVESGIRSIAQQRFSRKKILLIIAIEERAALEVKLDMSRLQEKYQHYFMDFIIVEHPDGLEGEARVKGANVTYAAKQAARYFTENGVAFENVVASCFDADTVVGPDYFACLTYHFMVCPERTRASFQPIPVYNNNIWEVPGFARILEMGSSFFLLMESTNKEKLVTFSSHSMSFKALVEVGYWPVDMISDDSAIFWKAYLHYSGNYRVVPMYVTLSMDVAAAETWWESARNVYRQKQRWAWGVENFPIVMRGFMRNKRISFYNKFRYSFKLLEGHVAWATWAFLLTLIGWLPGLFAARRDFSNSVMYYSAPRITSVIFHLAFISLFTTVILGLYLLPGKKMKHPVLKRVIFSLEWLLVPFIVTFLSALPALHTQTRFMMGGHMEFWVTRKSRKTGAAAKPAPTSSA